jgi:uncharacterized protein (DUF305 family)
MAKLKVEDILKPGAKLRTSRLSESEVKEAVEKCLKAQKEIREMQRWTQDNYDNMRKVITI